jgi:hypothetical protein
MTVFEAKMTVMLVSMLQNKNEISYQSRGCYPFIKYNVEEGIMHHTSMDGWSNTDGVYTP